MLNKRFKIAKCKTSLKLATSRIKLMKNKKEIQINQMKRELAQLLESGQDRTARIRVEHVIREEKMIAAYDLIEIYCELIVARLPIIESQKTCPIDLKEAITSVIFASPRCSDIPELDDAKKNFTAKYGKEFASAALELRPDSGVNRMMVEKLSAVAPDLQTKLKVLTEVAKEHNVNWDPSVLDEKESKPKDDLLNGPVNFEKVNMMNVDSPKIQTSNVQKVYSNEGKLNVPDDFSQQNRRYTLSPQNITSNDTNPSGMTSEMMNRRHSFHNNIHNSSSGRENNWNMDFKDATSAAQAAAESAERASMAARAAAQLSRQYSSESNKSHNRDETPQVSNPSEFHGQKPKIQSPRTDPWKHDTSPNATKEVIRKQPSNSGSSLSRSSTMSDEQKVGRKTVVDQQDHSRETKKISSYSDYHRDDETDSDDEYPKFDTVFEYDEGEAKSFFPSPGREESIRPIKNPHISSPRKNTAELNSRKTRIELNDLVEKGSSVYKSENEVKKVPSEQFSKVSQVVEKDNKFLNQDDDMGTGKELKFGTLTGGIRNKGGLNYLPYTKTGIADSLPSPKKLADQTSKPSSFKSRRSGIGKEEPSVYMSHSETESESDDGGDKFFKNRSQFRPPDVMFYNDVGIIDSDEEVVPVSKPTPARLSRRTKDYIEPKGKTVISRSSMHPSTNESSPTKKISEQPPKTSNLSSQISLEANKVKKPSHVHPNLPEYDSLAARIQSLQKK